MWTLRELAQVSYEEGLTTWLVHPDTIRATLHQLGVTWKKPNGIFKVRMRTMMVTAQAMPILPPHPLNPPLPNAALRLVEGKTTRNRHFLPLSQG